MSRNRNRNTRNNVQPADYKAPANTVRLDGQLIEVNPDIFDDYALVENYELIQNNDPSAMVRLMKLVFPTDEAYEQVKKLATVNGHVSIKKMGAMLENAMTQLNPNL